MSSLALYKRVKYALKLIAWWTERYITWYIFLIKPMKKNILYILFLLLVTYAGILNTFAQTNIDFNSNGVNFDIEDTIQLEINISTDSWWTNQLNLEWIDNFQIVGRNQSTRTQFINGEQSSVVTLQLTLLSKEAGTFTLWPVTTIENGDTISSRSIEITVSGERIMVNNKLQAFQQNLPQTQEESEEENIDNIILWWEVSKKDLEEKQIIWIDWSIMTDIYPEKWPLFWYPVSKQSLIFLIFSIIAFWFFCVLKKYISSYIDSRDENTPEEIIELVEPKPKSNFTTLLSNLENNYISENKEIFYWKATDIYRTFLDEWELPWASNMSFKQAKKELFHKPHYIKFYEKIYFPEYNTISDSLESRKEIIQEMKNTIIIPEE